ncbi:MAG: hypothetical protein V3V19_08965 [Cocleimonas sp.]
MIKIPKRPARVGFDHFIILRLLHELVAKEKSADISLIEAKNELDNGFLASFPWKRCGILVIFARHLTCATVSISMNLN